MFPDHSTSPSPNAHIAYSPFLLAVPDASRHPWFVPQLSLFCALQLECVTCFCLLCNLVVSFLPSVCIDTKSRASVDVICANLSSVLLVLREMWPYAAPKFGLVCTQVLVGVVAV